MSAANARPEERQRQLGHAGRGSIRGGKLAAIVGVAGNRECLDEPLVQHRVGRFARFEPRHREAKSSSEMPLPVISAALASGSRCASVQ